MGARHGLRAQHKTSASNKVKCSVHKKRVKELIATFSLGTFGKNRGQIYNLNFLCTSRISFRFLIFVYNAPEIGFFRI